MIYINIKLNYSSLCFFANHFRQFGTEFWSAVASLKRPLWHLMRFLVLSTVWFPLFGAVFWWRDKCIFCLILRKWINWVAYFTWLLADVSKLRKNYFSHNLRPKNVKYRIDNHYPFVFRLKWKNFIFLIYRSMFASSVNIIQSFRKTKYSNCILCSA